MEAILNLPPQSLRDFFPALAQEHAPLNKYFASFPFSRQVARTGSFEESLVGHATVRGAAAARRRVPHRRA